MPLLTRARGDQISAIHRESHALWGGGLGFGDYRGLWDDLARTAWARRRAGLYAWVDGSGRLLSSVKLYRPAVRVGERVGRATVIGALFTPARQRGQGHATNLLGAVLERARKRRDLLALLFSDIGTSYYLPFGFRALPAEEHWGALPEDPRPPQDWGLRPLVDGELTAVRAAHDAFCRSRPIAVLRDAEHWGFLVTRSTRYFERLKDASLCPRILVATRVDRFAGYLMTVEGRGEWNVREVGAADGDPATMAAILRLGGAAARRDGLRGFYAWLPPGVPARLADWGVGRRPRRHAVPMLLDLGGGSGVGAALATAEDAYLSFQDQF